ncbi:MAG: dehydrogenase E1 component subunit alpha/beta [Candidatus Marinimicrobia bacterium]|nr:dehydrogenase E1 component subunit alpha/beta [Candidatus Neomarinimicrobiota bacterium]
MIEERMLLLLRQGKISKWFSGIGQEAIAVGAALALKEDDQILPMMRNLGVFTTRGVELKKLFCQLMGKDGGFTKGRDRTFHFGHPEKNITGMISHLAAMLPVANGYGLAYQLNREKQVALAFIGDGATSEGDFHEALNLAAVWKLPVIFLIENNGYGLSTPTSEQYACENLVDRARGYGICGVKIDGNNILEVIKEIKKSADFARQGKGPTLIEAATFRMRGHEEASGTKYVPKKLFEKWEKHDPIKNFEKYLSTKNWFTDLVKQAIEDELTERLNVGIDFALNAPFPESTESAELKDVYAPIEHSYTPPNGKINTLRFVDAIKESLFQKMESDEKVILMGQDIAEYGGVFKISEGFVEKFGKERVRNTPIIESGIIGAAMGLSFEGFKPVVEMQFADFVSCGFNQIVNNLAKNYYRWEQGVNVTIRMPSGGGINAGPFHSQNPEAWFFHVPGLKIVYPSTPEDAKGLLHAAIDDPNPVLFFEHKGLYRSIKSEVPENLYHIPFGEARLVQEGKELSIITYGKGVSWAMDISKKMNISTDIIDLRSLIPLDEKTLLSSIKKTNRAIVLHEANLTGGIGGEIASIISEKAFEYLDAPVTRVASLDTPIPFGEKLESNLYLPLRRLQEKINQVLEY